MTRLIHSLACATALQGGVVTIGHFDGVHLGHQALLRHMHEVASTLPGAPRIVITFEPHASEYFASQLVSRLTNLREKFLALSTFAVDDVLVLPFNQGLATLTAPEFIRKILYDSLRIKHLIVGEGFRFGHQRQGDVALLAKAGRQFGFTVEVMPPVLLAGRRVSSTWVRLALKQNDQPLIQSLLGHPYTMLGRVIHGKRLGHPLGFPTANIALRRLVSPIEGVYTVYLHGLYSSPLPGVASIGTRPTLGGGEKLLEVHLLDFNEDIYGRTVSVEFAKKLRDEATYPSVALLREQIARDVTIAREYFAHANAPS